MTILLKKYFHFKIKIAHMFISFSFVSDDILQTKFIARNDHHHNNYNFRNYCQAVNFRSVITSICNHSLPLRYTPVTRLLRFIM